MVTISTTSGAVTVTFSDNDHYLVNGTISFPLNSLVLVTDDSQMATFRNLAEDIVFSATYQELGMSKNDLIALYESSFVGGAGVTPEDVEEMIEEAVSGKQDTSGMTAYTTTATTDALNTVVTAHTANTTIHVTSADKTNWDAKVDQSDLDAYATTTALDNHTANTTVHVTSTEKANWDAKIDQSDLDEAVSGKADTNDVNEALEVATRALFELKEDKQDVSAMTSYATTSALNSHTSDETIHVTSTDKSNWGGAVTALGGNKIVALTQAEYDALTVKDAHTLYIITNNN